MLHKNQILTLPTYPSHITPSPQNTPFAKSLGGNRIIFNTKIVMIIFFCLQGLEYWKEIRQRS